MRQQQHWAFRGVQGSAALLLPLLPLAPHCLLVYRGVFDPRATAAAIAPLLVYLDRLTAR